MGIFTELKRRNVFRVAVAYLAACWVLVQVAETLFPVYEIPDSIIRLMVTVLVIGFPVTLVLAWIFELTPEGIRKESEIDRAQSTTGQTGQTLNRAIMVMLVIGVAFFAVDKFVLDPQRDAELAETVRAEVKQEVAEEARGENSIAVLPFRDMSAAGDQQYFSDGISEELLNALVRVDGLKVASRTSSFVYRGDELPITDIAEELLVTHVLEGSVRKSGDRVRITAQLIDATSDRHLWSETYDRDLDDVLVVQTEIANAIVSAMRSRLGLEMGEARIATETDSADAYDLYLKGRGMILARSELDVAIEFLQQATTLDPDFAKAWEVLSAAYFIAPSWGYTFDYDSRERSWEAAERALLLDDRLGLALSVKASIGLMTRRYDYADLLELERQAIELDPKSATVRLWHGLHLSDVGLIDEAIDAIRACLEIDPGYENCRRHLAHTEYVRGNEEEAVRLYMEGAENGFFGNEVYFVAVLLRQLGREAAALAAVTLTQSQGFPVGDLLDILEDPSGDHAVKRQRLASRMQDFNWSNLSSYNLIGILAGDLKAGENEFQDSWAWLWGPDLEEFRRSESFQVVLERQGIAAYWREYGPPPMCREEPGGSFSCN